MSDAVRLITIHPVLVHLTLGLLPFVVLAYVMAAWRRSERWTFAADAAATLVALVTVGTLSFGFVSNALAPWPGGFGPWRWLHLAFGIVLTVLLLTLASVRLARRRAHPVAGRGTLALALAIALVAGFEGWIGGEVLVFHAGVGVLAAGDGSLAPPVPGMNGHPRTLRAAMGPMRSAWAASVTRLAMMTANQPSARDFDEVRRQAARLAALSDWLASSAPPGPGRDGGPAAPAGDEDDGPEARREHLAEMAGMLADRSRALAQAAARRDLAEATREAGRINTLCVVCHQEFRWRERPGPGAPSPGDRP